MGYGIKESVLRVRQLLCLSSAVKYGSISKAAEKNNMKQFLVPYLMSSHPGSTLESAVKLAEYLRDIGHQVEQVQDFYPTPATASTCMYYTGIDPRTGEAVYVPKNPHEKEMQRALIQYRDPKNYDLIKDALYNRNIHVEEQIGIKFEWIGTPGNYHNQAVYL